jgi:hypothetical protein
VGGCWIVAGFGLALTLLFRLERDDERKQDPQ